MSETNAVSLRKIIAGAAHGAWMGVLVGALLLTVSWAAFMAAVTFAPDLITTFTAMPVKDIWVLIIRWYAAFKLLLFGWAIFASFLSFWWKTL